MPAEYHRLHHVQKLGNLKFFECPRSAITPASWELLDLVNETTDENGRIHLLPYPGTYLQQPPWYRQGVKVKRAEQNSRWYADELKDWRKRQSQ